MLVTVSLLFSCGGNNGGENDDTHTIFSPNVSVTVIKPAGDKLIDTALIADTLADITGKPTAAKDDSFTKEGNEIVVGNTNRDITGKAIEFMGAALKKAISDLEEDGIDSEGLLAYGVYSEGGSVAIVWSDDTVRDHAIEYFVNNFLTGTTLKLQDGYKSFKTLDNISALAEKENEEREKQYAAVREMYGVEVENAVRSHLAMFSDKYYLWLADLYDPGEYDAEGNPLGGGFYFSNSGRDTPGFGVDLESTAQVLAFLGNSGMIPSKVEYYDIFPEKMQKEMIAFALNAQSPVDGYFYHPQWGTDVKNSRLSRDCGWAVRILGYFGEMPYWNTPTGAEGQYGDPPGVEPASALSGKLSDSKVTAVSKVISVAGTKKWHGSAHLASLDAWEAYLEDLMKDIRTKSYSIGNTVASQASQIENRESIAKANNEKTGYIALFEEYFNKYQLSNGLWEECSVENKDVYYNAINGLMKISGGYNSLGVKLNYAEEAIRAATYMITYIGSSKDGSDWADCTGKKPDNSVDVYNPWVCINNILKSVRDNDGDEAAEALRTKYIKPYALEMIQVTSKKIAMFARVDGSYCYNWGGVGSTSQGAPVAVGGTIEGDVNGGNIAFTGTYREMTNALGFTVKPFGYSDFLRFIGRIEELGQVIKDEATAVRIYDFDDDVIGTQTPSDVTLSLGTGAVEVIEDDRAGSDGNVLRFTTEDGAGTSITFKPATLNGASASVLEWDMKFEESAKDSKTAFQIRIGDSYMLTMGITPDGVLTIGDASSTGAGLSTKFDVKLDGFSWNSFKVEFYVLDAEERSTIARVYINGDLRFTSTNYFGKESSLTPNLRYTYARFYALNAPDFTCCFDNVKAYPINEPYSEKPIFNPERIKDFEKIPEGAAMPIGVASNGAVVNDNGNNILLLDGESKKAEISATIEGAEINCYLLNTKMKIETDTVGTVSKLYLVRTDATKSIVAYEAEVYEEDGKKLAKLTEFDRAGNKGNSFAGIPVGEWFELTVEFYPYFYESEESSIVYLNGGEIGRGTLYYYIGTVAGPYAKMIIENVSDVKVYLDDVIPESVKKSFTDRDGAAVNDPSISLPEMGASTNTPEGEEHNGKFDFEGYELGTPEVPGLRTTVNADEYENRIIIAADPKDAANTVLKHTVVKSSSGSSSYFIASKDASYDAKCYTFSHDLYVEAFSSGGIQCSIKGKIGTTEVNMYQNNISISVKDGKAYITIKAKKDAEKDLAEGEAADAKTLVVESTEISGWVNIRYELYTEEAKMQIYFDDKFVGETDIVYTARMGATLYRAGIFTTSGTNATIYYDNVVVEATTKEYEKKAPVKILGTKFNYEPITAAKDFEDGVIKGGIINEHKIAEGDESYVAVSVAANPFTENVGNAVGKVLKASIGKGATATNPLTNKIIPANLTKATADDGTLVESVGTYVFSYDVRYDGLGAVTKDTAITDVIFDHAPGSNREKAYWNFFTFYITKSGTFSLKPAGNQTGTPNRDFICADIALNDGKWHNVRFVVEKAGADSVTSVFIDDVCIVNRLNCYYWSADTDANTYINDVYFRQRKIASFDYDVYYDNIYFEYVGNYDFVPDAY